VNVDWDYRAGTAAAEPGVRIDPAFPQAASFADPASIDSALLPALGLGPVAGAPEILNVSYVPGRELRVVYRFSPPAGPPPVVRVDFAAPGTAPAVFERARRKAADPGRVALVAGWGAVAWLVPEDERLPQLAGLVDPEPAASALTRALGRQVREKFSVRLLRYVPRRRAVLRYDGSGSVVVKASRMRDEGDCHRRQVALFGHAGSAFRLPRPLGHDPVLGMRVEEAVDGASVGELLDGAGAGPLLDGVAGSIAALHAVALHTALPAIGSADLLAHLEEKTLGRITATLPDLAVRVTALADRLRATEPAADGARVTLHGDFHPANLVIDRNGPVFIDLDNLAVGPPERDLAVFAGRLVLMGLADGRAPEAAAAPALGFQARYAGAGGATIRRDVLGWYLATTILARQVANGVRRLAPGLPRLAAALLDLAEEAAPAGRH
jgi:Phosphotransferase enzyme family